MPQTLTFSITTSADNTTWPVATATGAYTVPTGVTMVKADASGGAFTVTLPDAAGDNADRVIIIKKIDATANAVTVDGDGADTIDGATTNIISVQNASITVVSDGSNWCIA